MSPPPGYRGAREGAACMRAPMALLRFRGPDVSRFLQGLLTNDVEALRGTEGQATCLLTPKGKLVSYLALYRRGEDMLALCPEESAPAARAVFAKHLPLSKTEMAEEDAPWLALGPRVPEEGLDLGCLLPNLRARALASAPAGAEPLSAEAFEVLRVEAGLPAMGRDTDAESLPPELGLERAISYEKGCYMGQETMAKLKNLGRPARRLIGLTSAGPLRAGDEVRAGGRAVGRVTSVVESPRLGASLALALVGSGAELESVPLPLR